MGSGRKRWEGANPERCSGWESWGSLVSPQVEMLSRRQEKRVPESEVSPWLEAWVWELLAQGQPARGGT